MIIGDLLKLIRGFDEIVIFTEANTVIGLQSVKIKVNLEDMEMYKHLEIKSIEPYHSVDCGYKAIKIRV